MAKNKKIGLLLATIIIVYSFSFLTVADKEARVKDSLIEFKNSMYNYKENVKEIKKDKNKDKILLEVNNKIYTQEDFETLKILLKTEDYSKIESHILKINSMENIAKHKNIKVSDKDVNDYINSMKTIIATNENANQKFKVFLDAKGISEEDYWDSSNILEEQKQALITGRLKEKIREDLKEQYIEKDNFEIESLLEDEINNLVKENKKELKIKKNYK